VVRIELRRSDIGFGRLIVDDEGVTRRRLIRTRQIAWSEIRRYRLSLELRGVTGDTGYVVAGPLAWIADYGAAREGRHGLRFGMRLEGAESSLAFNWRFRDVHTAIAAVLGRLHAPISARANAELASTKVARFGDLALAEHGIQWRDRAPLPRGAVECVQVFDSTEVSFRVMQKDRARPYCKCDLADVPDVMSALELAHGLGYRVDGLELLASLRRTG
jgi:hypothetical protein